jgi:hypothetical protein
MSDLTNERFARLIKSLSLSDIRPMELQSQRLGDLPLQGHEVQIQWNQAFADGDPVEVSPLVRVFRPKYEFSVKLGENDIFHQVSKFVLVFSISDSTAFNELWLDEELRKVFMAKQIQKTIWPIFRQHVLDGMSRLGMQPIPLPWIT